ncbi:MAG: hypothetical protein Kow0074_05980 [Candidatus Zixiibacteriota bacterium]
MVERIAALLGGGDEDLEVLHQRPLTDKFIEPFWTDRFFDGEIIAMYRRFGKTRMRCLGVPAGFEMGLVHG